MIRQGFKRLMRWFRKNRDYGRSHKLSDYRAASTAEKLICSGSLQSTRLTGSPLERAWK